MVIIFIMWVIFPDEMEMSVFMSHGDGEHIFCEDYNGVLFMCRCRREVSPGSTNFS